MNREVASLLIELATTAAELGARLHDSDDALAFAITGLVIDCVKQLEPQLAASEPAEAAHDVEGVCVGRGGEA